MHNFDKTLKVVNPKLHKKLGVVYTPVEIVDFILNSVVDALKIEFNKELKDVKILDPFTGTGVFITRLLQMYDLDGGNVYANEIIEDAYNIAVENIRGCVGGDRVNILLTDTFKIRDGIFDVIIGNPPYSVGQRSENDNNKNDKYEELDRRIVSTYLKFGKSKGAKNSLFDSYVRALRWSSDRIAEQGIIGFVSNGSWIDNSSMDGLRHCFENEFSKIYVFDLRGSVRSTIGNRELSKKEGGNVFGQGSMIKITITLFIKNHNHHGKCQIHYHDIGDYLNTQEKKEIIKNFKSYINPDMRWKILTPNDHNDWINQRSGDFNNFMPLGDKKKLYKNDPVFELYSLGAETNRDSWVYDFNFNNLKTKMKSIVEFYNDIIDGKTEFSYDKKRISWSGSLIDTYKKKIRADYDENKIRVNSYRPFSKRYCYFDKIFTHSQSLIPKIFPTGDAENIVISCAGIGIGNKHFSTLITDITPDLGFNYNSQNFPLYHYKKLENDNL